MVKKVVSVLVAVVMVFGLSHSAFAVLQTFGPIDPVTTFPQWYSDTNGLALDMCLNPAACVFDPPIPGNAFSQQIGFGAEAFYWSADALIPIPTGNALLVLALEAAFASATGDPEPGQQIVFSRVRIRIDAPVAGQYTVTHPYGQEVFNVVTPGPAAINFTNDVGGAVGGDFAGALAGDIGPFLTAVAPAPPLGFIGNGLIDQTVTGSPTGNNFFRVVGPPGSNLDGLGGNTIQTNLFALQGHVFTGGTAVINVIDARYLETPTRVSVDLFANAPATATMTANFGTGPAPMVSNGAGGFFLHVDAPPGTPIPATVTLTATIAGQPPTTATPAIKDRVLILSANYTVSTQTLSVRAQSSDRVAPVPALGVLDIAPMTNGVMVLPGVTVPPASVVVVSSNGGADFQWVNVIP